MIDILNKIDDLEWHSYREWGTRSLDEIDKIIIHQELGSGDVEAVNRYHITPSTNNHLSEKGAPHFAYHFGIERDGTVIQANELNQVTWHTSGQNTSGIGVMLVGNFSGTDYIGKQRPTFRQLYNVEKLIDCIMAMFPQLNNKCLFGHSDFGKPACPGYEVVEFIKDYRYEL